MPARLCQARDESATARIAHRGHDDGDRAGGLLGSEDDRIPGRHDDIDLQPDELCEKLRKPVELSVRRPEFDDEVLALHVAELAQTVARGLPQMAADIATFEKRDSSDPRASLPLSGERRGKEAERDAGDECPPVHYSMT